MSVLIQSSSLELFNNTVKQHSQKVLGFKSHEGLGILYRCITDHCTVSVAILDVGTVTAKITANVWDIQLSMPITLQLYFRFSPKRCLF